MAPSSKRRFFGTDGVRGVANQHPMTCEVALALGRAVAYQAQAHTSNHRIIIGKDPRLSGYMLEMAFASGVCSMGVDALLLGPMPTPAVAFLTRTMRADAGVMISASHNPYEDNGIKIFARDGFKLADEKEVELESFMEDEKVGKVRPTKAAVGKAFRIDDAAGRYIVFLKSFFPADLDLLGMTVCVDCANGAAYKVAPTVFSELGAKVHAIGVSPDGRNINRRCGALHPASLKAAIKRHRANIGIALDGDADRLIVVDETGAVVDGDILMSIAAEEMLRSGDLHDNTLVTTVMSNLALDKKLTSLGGKVIRTQVGDRYVVAAMREGNLNFGGEQSGHLIYLDHSTTGDGLLAAIKLLAVLKRTGIKLSELKHRLELYPQSLVNVVVKERRPLEDLPTVQSAIDRVQKALGDDGRILVRFSGTEAKARVLVEGPDARMVDTMASEIASEIARALG
ncbi:MAG: phosphoglucosamine mutase [Deltaproteobacteria bacterium RIFOXYA12_FULL_58_15]|nr:MAG: phosphoglucosamine mutase [Deltaproteobacteria bacterium RIFOXYA12_FULL_58_15]OGR13781.1 MAG: phosphoglucosamine mutase [Deltaproteobacteria bacterium RIFOXYB12_FULL_58_9]